MNSSFDKDHETMSCCVFLLRAEIESPPNRCPLVLLHVNKPLTCLPQKITGLVFHFPVTYVDSS